MFSRRTMLIFPVLLFLLTGCATTMKGTGFLENYDGFETRSDGTMRYVEPGKGIKALGAYDHVMIDPVTVWYAADAGYRGINPDELKAVTDYFHSAMVRSVSGRYKVVDKPGKGVLRIRSALTGVEKKKPERGALGYIPAAFVLSKGIEGARAMAGKTIYIAEASLEAEAVDSETGKRIMAVVTRHPGEKFEAAEGEKLSWRNLQGALDYWARRLREVLDENR